MRKSLSLVAAAGAALLAGNLALMPAASAEAPLPTDKQCSKNKPTDNVTKGWCVMINRKKGNCLACHDVITKRFPPDFPAAGNIGPPLVSMKARFPDAAKLRAQIWDPQISNPQTVMPPFGKHRILSEQELDKVVEYIHSL